MKFVDEYRDRDLAQKYAHAIRDTVTQPWLNTALTHYYHPKLI